MTTGHKPFQVRITFNSASRKEAESMLDKMIAVVGEERCDGAILLRPRPTPTTTTQEA